MNNNLKSEDDILNLNFIYQYVESDPSKTYADFKKEFPETKITEAIFCSRKHFILHKKKSGSCIDNKVDLSKLKYEDSVEFVYKYLATDSTKGYKDLKRDFPQTTMLSSTFGSRKRRFILHHEPDKITRTYSKRKNNSLCLTIWEYSLISFSDENKSIIKNAIKSLVDTINGLGRVNWQMVELMNPQILELREISK